MEGVSGAQGKLSWKLPETQEPKAPHDGWHRGPEARAIALHEQDARLPVGSSRPLCFASPLAGPGVGEHLNAEKPHPSPWSHSASIRQTADGPPLSAADPTALEAGGRGGAGARQGPLSS